MRAFLLSLAALIVVIVASNLVLNAGPKRIEYFSAPVERLTIVESVSATGSAEPLEVYYVQSEILGVVQSVDATFNDIVTKDTKLAAIGTEVQRVQAEKAMADKDAAEAAVKMAEIGIELARSAEKAATADFDAAQRAYEEAKASFEQTTPLIPKTQVDQQMDRMKKAQAGLEAARQQVAQAVAQNEAATYRLEAARVGVRASQLELNKAELKSPVDGVILNVNCKVGDTVGRPKLNLTEPSPALFEIARPLDRMRTIVRVNEVDYSRVQLNQTARFTIDAYPDVEFVGKVVQIRNSAQSDRTSVTYDTVIEFENRLNETTKEWMVRPRATCRAEILVRQVEDAIAVPSDALLFSPPVGSVEIPSIKPDQSLIWVLNESGKIEPRAIKVGISDGFHTQVLSGDLRVNEKVVTGIPATNEGFKLPAIGG